VAETIKVTITVPALLRHGVELADKRAGEDIWERQARTLDELGYEILPKREAPAVPELVALCGNVDEFDGTHCSGRLRYRWGQTEAACDTCGARCGIAVARWESVAGVAAAAASSGKDVPARLDAAADALAECQHFSASEAVRDVAHELREIATAEVRAAVAAALARPAEHEK
jgi:hypothetical protein